MERIHLRKNQKGLRSKVQKMAFLDIYEPTMSYDATIRSHFGCYDIYIEKEHKTMLLTSPVLICHILCALKGGILEPKGI